LAKDIRDLRRHTKAPRSAIRKLIELNKEKYPRAFERPPPPPKVPEP
jgi:hypothetical protein